MISCFVIHFLQFSLGFRVIILSIIDRGAGSVAVRALPAFHTTFSTSGIFEIILLVSRSISKALFSETSGRVTGIYMILPSSRGGINSLHIFKNIQNDIKNTIKVIQSTVFLNLSEKSKRG